LSLRGYAPAEPNESFVQWAAVLVGVSYPLLAAFEETVKVQENIVAQWAKCEKVRGNTSVSLAFFLSDKKVDSIC
jgi:hypothetical protein